MKKALALGVVAAITLVPAGALGRGVRPDYGGKVEKDPTDFIGFNVDKVHGKKKVHQITLINVPVSCNDGAVMRQTGSIRGQLTVDSNGHFGGVLREPVDKGGTTSTSLTFKINGVVSRARAHGTYDLHFQGHQPSGKCYTGQLTWKAKHPSPDPPAPIAP